ncbi:MAG TPA: hypothetical protein VN853_00665 [Polyangia bacterium]|nr:hypothetical protein [Polyangia bacterium]
MARIVARRLPAAALLLFVAGLSLRPMAESDLFFHLKTGQEILSRHALVSHNLFSFTYPEFPNLDTSWLAEVGAALVFRLGAFPALVIAKTLVLLLAFAGAYRLCRRQGAGPAASALALGAAAFVGADRFVERPHLFSLLGAVATLVALASFERGGPAARRTAAWFLPAVALWANLHAGVFVAPLMVGSSAVALALTGDRAAARRGASVAVGAALAMLATPVGLGLFRYLRLHLGLPAVHPVDEFRPPGWTSDAPLIVYGGAVALATAGLFATGDAPGRRAALRLLAPALPLAALAAHAVRFGADAALVAAPLLARAATLATARLTAGERPRLALLRAPRPAVAAALLLVGATLAPRLSAPRSSPERWGIGLDRRELPLTAIAFVDRNGLRERMYNDFEIGSYLLFDPVGGYPHHRVFVDPRLPAYPIEMHRLLGRGDLSRDAWDAAMDRYGVESALVAYAGVNRRVAWWDPARWALVFSRDDARVFVRRLPRFRSLIARFEIPATFTFSPEEGAATLALLARPAASPVAACEWDRRVGDLLVELDETLSDRARAAYDRALSAPAGCLSPADESRLGAWLGAVELAARRPKDALTLLDRALGAGNHELSTFTDRAAALEALGPGAAAEAAAAWREVAARASDSPLGARARARAARLEN